MHRDPHHLGVELCVCVFVLRRKARKGSERETVVETVATPSLRASADFLKGTTSEST